MRSLPLVRFVLLSCFTPYTPRSGTEAEYCGAKGMGKGAGNAADLGTPERTPEPQLGYRHVTQQIRQIYEN